jgi:predicted DNA-binding protein
MAILKNISITTRFPEFLNDKLKKIGGVLGKSRGELIRESVEYYMEEIKPVENYLKDKKC